MGDKLADKAEVLLRQIHPKMLIEGVPSSCRFRPSPMDEKKLSLDRGSMTTPSDSHARFTAPGKNGKAKESAAVFGVSVAEFEQEAITCHADEIKDDPELHDNPAHSVADYVAVPENKYKNAAKRLKALALARGCMFLAPA